MPEPDGLSLATAVAAVRTLAAAMPVVGFGATGITLANGDVDATIDAVATLAEAALGLSPASRRRRSGRRRSSGMRPRRASSRR